MRKKKPRLTEWKAELLRKEYPTGDLEKLWRELGFASRKSLYIFAQVLGIRRDKGVRYENLKRVNAELHRKERMRVSWGLPQRTKWHVARRLSKEECGYRTRLRAKGYIPGDCRTAGERKIIYYTDETVRCKRAETNAKRKGFRFEKLEE